MAKRERVTVFVEQPLKERLDLLAELMGVATGTAARVIIHDARELCERRIEALRAMAGDGEAACP